MFNLISLLLTLLISAIVLPLEAQELTDPTQPRNAVLSPATTGHTGKDGLTLQAVFIGTQERYAIINGQTLNQGDSINGFELVAVTATTVTMRDTIQGSEKQTTLMLNNSAIKKDRSHDF